MQNLQELFLFYQEQLSLDDLKTCLMVNPKLKVFKYIGCPDITTIYDILSKYYTDLCEFCDGHLQSPLQNIQRYNHIGQKLISRYDILSKF